LESLRDLCDVVVAVPNDDLLAHVDSAVLSDLYDRANPLLSGAVYALWQALSRPGYLRLDVADLRRLSSQTDGPCALGYADATGEERARRVAEALLAGPMLDQGRLLSKARLILIVIVGGADLRLQEVADIMGVLTPLVRPECRLTMGTALDDAWTGRVSVCALVGARRTVAATPATPQSPPPPAEVAGFDRTPDKTMPARGGGGKGRARGQQADLGLDVQSRRGRFKDVEPTLLQGEDLDVPTFVRRLIRIEK
jgi:cell division protein FtsZ